MALDETHVSSRAWICVRVCSCVCVHICVGVGVHVCVGVGVFMCALAKKGESERNTKSKSELTGGSTFRSSGCRCHLCWNLKIVFLPSYWKLIIFPYCFTLHGHRWLESEHELLGWASHWDFTLRELNKSGVSMEYLKRCLVNPKWLRPISNLLVACFHVISWLKHIYYTN